MQYIVQVMTPQLTPTGKMMISCDELKQDIHEYGDYTPVYDSILDGLYESDEYYTDDYMEFKEIWSDCRNKELDKIPVIRVVEVTAKNADKIVDNGVLVIPDEPLSLKAKYYAVKDIDSNGNITLGTIKSGSVINYNIDTIEKESEFGNLDEPINIIVEM